MIKKYKNLSVVAKASIWAFIAGVLQRGITVIATPIFTRILTPSEFAQYSLYQSWYDIFIIFSTLNVFNYATYSAMKEYKDDRNGFIATAQTLITGLCILCFAIYYIFHIFAGDIIGFPLPIMILMFLDILFFASFNLWAAKERYDFRYKIMTILSVIMGVVGPILGIILIHFIPNKGYGRIYGVALINILVGLFVYIYNLKKSKNLFNKKYIKFIFAYCIPLIPHFLSTKLLTRFDRIMINDMCGAAEAGIYSLAYSLSLLMVIVNDSILKAFTPWTYQTIKDGTNLESLKKNTNYMIILVALANIILILFAPEAIRFFSTKEYYEAIYIIPSVSASVYFTFLFNVFANIEYYFSETKYVALASIMAAISNVVLNFIFIKMFGYLAAGYTTLFSYILYAIGHYIFMRKVSKKYADGYNYYDTKVILIISLLFTIFSLAIIPFYGNMIIRYSIILILFIVLLLNHKKIINSLKNIK